jgi:hypothetical protein
MQGKEGLSSSTGLILSSVAAPAPALASTLLCSKQSFFKNTKVNIRIETVYFYDDQLFKVCSVDMKRKNIKLLHFVIIFNKSIFVEHQLWIQLLQNDAAPCGSGSTTLFFSVKREKGDG